MIGNRDSHRGSLRFSLHDDVTSAATSFDEAMLLKNGANLAAREDPKLTH